MKVCRSSEMLMMQRTEKSTKPERRFLEGNLKGKSYFIQKDLRHRRVKYILKFNSKILIPFIRISNAKLPRTLWDKE